MTTQYVIQFNSPEPMYWQPDSGGEYCFEASKAARFDSMTAAQLEAITNKLTDYIVVLVATVTQKDN